MNYILTATFIILSTNSKIKYPAVLHDTYEKFYGPITFQVWVKLSNFLRLNINIGKQKTLITFILMITQILESNDLTFTNFTEKFDMQSVGVSMLNWNNNYFSSIYGFNLLFLFRKITLFVDHNQIYTLLSILTFTENIREEKNTLPCWLKSSHFIILLKTNILLHKTLQIKHSIKTIIILTSRPDITRKYFLIKICMCENLKSN